jgi:tricorn protease
VNAVALSGSGPVVVGSGYLRDYAYWKRYRGGTAGRLWTSPDGNADFAEFLGELAGPKTHPTWLDGRLAFLADFEGHGNVYSVAADGSKLRRHSDHSQFYARQLAGDGSRVVYQHAGEIWMLGGAEPALAPDSRPHRLDISLGSTRSGRDRHRIDAAKSLGALSVDRTGRASAVEVRGKIVWLTHRNGPAPAMAATEGVRHRLPVVLATSPSTEAASVAYVTDAQGADGIEIASGPYEHRRYGTGQIGRVLELVASPDGQTLAFATHDGRLLTMAVSDGDITEIERNEKGEPTGLAFSPDSRWLAYSAAEGAERLRSIRLADLGSGAIAPVTTARFLDSDPSFSPDGKYLYFLSARTFDPVYDAHVFDLAFPLATRPYLVTLAADTPSPFAPEIEGQELDGPGADTGTPAAPQASQPEPSGSGGPATADLRIDLRIDLAGIAHRVVAFPVAAGRLGELMPAKGGVIWTDSPISGELGESRNPGDDIRPSLQRWDFGKRRQLELATRVDQVEISGDGTKLVVRDGEAVKVVPADHKPAEDGSESHDVDLSRIRLTVDPPAEWAQMLDETGRLMRDHFWTPDMSGLDWDGAVDKYRPLVDRITTRDDLSDLLWEVNGETGSSHAYETPPPKELDDALKPAFLGADLARDGAGRWVIERILAGDNSAIAARSPLTAPGVSARVGDVVVAVNGQRLGGGPSGPGPAELLLGTADKPVELRLARADAEHLVAVVPLSTEVELRYLDWVSGRRAIVHEQTGRRVGYVHIPDMVSSGWAALHRDLAVEMDRDALIVDTRDNRGGHTSELVIEKLVRRVIGWGTNRHYPSTSYPSSAPRGPIVSIANEWAGSDGDIVNAAFQALGLGPVIGTRTWGGVIGIDGKYRLVDGTSVTQPRYAFWFEKFGWDVENHGVDPDIVVEYPPHAWARGEDPQLSAAIERVMAELQSRPAPARPDLSRRPSLAIAPLPPRP